MTPLERATQALCELHGRVSPETHPQFSEAWRTLYMPQARAVLQAIREPSVAMEAAGYGNSKGDPDNTGVVDNPRPDDAWRAMIDAALEEG